MIEKVENNYYIIDITSISFVIATLMFLSSPSMNWKGRVIWLCPFFSYLSRCSFLSAAILSYWKKKKPHQNQPSLFVELCILFLHLKSSVPSDPQSLFSFGHWPQLSSFLASHVSYEAIDTKKPTTKTTRRMTPGKDKLSILAFKSSIFLWQGKHL